MLVTRYQAAQRQQSKVCSRHDHSSKSLKSHEDTRVRIQLWLCPKALQETKSANTIGMTLSQLHATQSAEYRNTLTVTYFRHYEPEDPSHVNSAE
jgi:hypothetical protein